jgi:hypothetical protein
MKKITFVLIALVFGSFLIFNAPQAQAYLYDFYKITNNGNVNVANQLSVDVLDFGTGKVEFTFSNSGPIASSISEIYFDDGTLLGIAQIIYGSGVSFVTPTKPTDLPGGNLASPPFVATQTFLAGAENPSSTNGVNPGEFVTIVFTLINGKNYSDTLSAISSGELRFGLHVQAIDPANTNGSDSFVNTVPIPAAAWLLGSGLVGLVAIRRRKK